MAAADNTEKNEHFKGTSDEYGSFGAYQHHCAYFEGEILQGDLHKTLIRNCPNYTKNNHADFHPLASLTIDQLPEGERDPEILEAVKLSGQITCKVVVEHISSKRPRVFPRDEEYLKSFPAYRAKVRQKYPFYNPTGNVTTRCGTGFISFLFSNDKNITEKCHCKCSCNKLPRECVCIDKCQEEALCFAILTATHVVFDHEEAAKTHLEFDYQTNDEKYIIKASRVKLMFHNLASDTTGLGLYFHVHGDEMLAGYQQGSDVPDLKVGEEWFYSTADAFLDLQDNPAVMKDGFKNTEAAFIVSYPHGLEKVVSFGRFVDFDQTRVPDIRLRRNSYAIPTCPGSSGSLVLAIGKNCSLTPHSGSYKNGLCLSAWSYNTSFYWNDPHPSKLES